MNPLNIASYGLPVPIREAITAAASEIDIEVAHDLPEVDPDRCSILLVYCDSHERWELLGNFSKTGHVVVGIVTEVTVDIYAKALSCGASGVVHYNTSTAIIMSIIRSAAAGEVVLPVFTAQALAAEWTRIAPVISLTDYEKRLITSLSEGITIREISDTFSYSERTIGRHLQGVFLKLGACNRFEAIQIASRHRII